LSKSAPDIPDSVEASVAPPKTGKSRSKEAMPEHAVIVKFRYGLSDLKPLREVEDRLESVIAAGGVGEVDGDEIAVDLSDGSLYMYGPDADKLFAVARPVLESATFMKGATVALRYGPPEDGVREATFTIGNGR
jgi:hypothetical protein